MRVSNEPCVDEKYCRRCELARKRMKDFSDTYGECRDSEQMPCICEPVVHLRACRHGELRPARHNIISLDCNTESRSQKTCNQTPILTGQK